MLVESLEQFHRYYGDDFRIECPTGSGRYPSLAEIADVVAERLASNVRRDAGGRRPVFGDVESFHCPALGDLIPFYEHFHGDTGRGVGASRQTGWTALVASLLDDLGRRDREASRQAVPGTAPTEATPELPT